MNDLRLRAHQRLQSVAITARDMGWADLSEGLERADRWVADELLQSGGHAEQDLDVICALLLGEVP